MELPSCGYFNVTQTTSVPEYINYIQGITKPFTYKSIPFQNRKLYLQTYIIIYTPFLHGGVLINCWYTAPFFFEPVPRKGPVNFKTGQLTFRSNLTCYLIEIKLDLTHWYCTILLRNWKPEYLLYDMKCKQAK